MTQIPIKFEGAQDETEDNWAGEQQWTNLMDVLRNLQSNADEPHAPCTSCTSPAAARAQGMFRRFHDLLHVIKGDLEQFKLEKAQFEVEKARFDLEKARFELEKSVAGIRPSKSDNAQHAKLPPIRDPQAPHEGDPDKVIDTHPYRFPDAKAEKENPKTLHKFTESVLGDAKEIIEHCPPVPDPKCPKDVDAIDSRRAEQTRSSDSTLNNAKIFQQQQQQQQQSQQRLAGGASTEARQFTHKPAVRDPQAPHEGDPDKVVDTSTYHFLDAKVEKENAKTLHKFNGEVLDDAKQIIEHCPSIQDPQCPKDTICSAANAEWTHLPCIRDPQAPHEGDKDAKINTRPYRFPDAKEEKENPKTLHKFTESVLGDAKQIIEHFPAVPDPKCPKDVDAIDSRRAEQISTEGTLNTKIMA